MNLARSYSIILRLPGEHSDDKTCDERLLKRRSMDGKAFKEPSPANVHDRSNSELQPGVHLYPVSYLSGGNFENITEEICWG